MFSKETIEKRSELYKKLHAAEEDVMKYACTRGTLKQIRKAAKKYMEAKEGLDDLFGRLVT